MESDYSDPGNSTTLIEESQSGESRHGRGMMYPEQRDLSPINYMSGNGSYSYSASASTSRTSSAHRKPNNAPKRVSSYVASRNRNRAAGSSSPRRTAYSYPNYSYRRHSFRPRVSNVRHSPNSRSSSSKSKSKKKKDSTSLGHGDDDNSTTTESTDDDSTTTAAPEPEDPFFTSYGGDIEYFFPLVSYGIPFDGEITFLGFHGFKGLFPY